MRFLKLGDIPLKNKASSKARTMFLSCSTDMAWPELSGYVLRKKWRMKKKKRIMLHPVRSRDLNGWVNTQQGYLF